MRGAGAFLQSAVRKIKKGTVEHGALKFASQLQCWEDTHANAYDE